MGPAAPPLLPHLPVQERILGPSVLLEQGVQAVAFLAVAPGAVPNGLLDRHLGRLPRRIDIAQRVGQRGLAQPGRQPVPGVALGHPGIADVVGGSKDRGHPAAPSPGIGPHLAAQPGDPRQAVVLVPVQPPAVQDARNLLSHRQGLLDRCRACRGWEARCTRAPHRARRWLLSMPRMTPQKPSGNRWLMQASRQRSLVLYHQTSHIPQVSRTSAKLRPCRNPARHSESRPLGPESSSLKPGCAGKGTGPRGAHPG